MAKTKRPIFILGCQRSGTSMMRRILNTHSSIACGPESSFLVQLVRIYEIERAIDSLQSLGFSKEYVLKRMRAFAEHFFTEYAKRHKKKRWADKTPHYVNHLNTIDLMFDHEPQYVAILRHGMDVASSLCDFDWGILKPYLEQGIPKPIAGARFWQEQNKKLFAFQKKAKERFFLIRYEELTTNPVPVLKKMFTFLGEPWEEEVLDFNKRKHDKGFEDPKIARYEGITPNSNLYKKWPRVTQNKVYKEIKETLKKYHYQF